MHATDMGELLGACIDTARLYNECRLRHKALADSLKPGGFWDVFR